MGGCYHRSSSVTTSGGAGSEEDGRPSRACVTGASVRMREVSAADGGGHAVEDALPGAAGETAGGGSFQAQAAVEEAGGGDRADAGDALDPVGRVSGQAGPTAPGAGRHPVASLDLLGADEPLAGRMAVFRTRTRGDELVHVPVPDMIRASRPAGILLTRVAMTSSASVSSKHGGQELPHQRQRRVEAEWQEGLGALQGQIDDLSPR